jgi:hypothetical protein
MSRQVPDSARPSRAGIIVVAVVVVGVVLGGLAAFATTLGGPAVRPTAAQGLEAGGAPAGSGGADGTRRSLASGAGTAGRHADPFSPTMTSYLAGRAGTVVAAVYDLRTGQTWTLGHGTGNPSQQYGIDTIKSVSTYLWTAMARPTRPVAGTRA